MQKSSNAVKMSTAEWQVTLKMLTSPCFLKAIACNN